jgi:muconate cycloisomerase
MKINRVELIPVHTPRETGLVTQHVIVRLYTDTDIVGLGEMSDLNHAPHYMPRLDDLKDTLERILVGRDPRQLVNLQEALMRAYPQGGKASLVRCAVDIALHDLLGKAWGVPVYDLLGGKVRDRLRVCYPIFRHRSKAEVAENIRRVGDRLAQGHDMIRLYVGGDLDADELFLRTLREKHGDQVVLKSIDMSRLLRPKTAIQAIERLKPYGYILAESPCPTLGGLAEVRARVDVPISEHVRSLEWAFQAAKARAVDIFNVSLSSMGGIYQASKVFAVAEAAGIGCLIGTTQELSIGTAAQAHLGAAMANLTHPCDPTGPLLYQQDVVRERVRYEGGHLVVPDGVGLGVEVDEEVLAELRHELSASSLYG